MNPILKKQLQNCRVANVPEFDDNIQLIHIPKGSVLNVTPYQVGKCYLVELADYVVNPPEGYTLASNWNKGSSPKYKFYKCEIVKIVGKMICILGCGFDADLQRDTNDLWEGWVPQAGIKLLQELK